MPARVLFTLTAAFLLGASCFLGSTCYVGRVSRDIDASATAIATDAMPSIELLTETRGELRRLDAAATRFERSRGDAERAELLAARAAIDDAFEQYLSLPPFPDEQPLWAAMHRGLTAVDRAVTDLLADGAAGTSGEVTRAVAAAVESMRGGIDLNASHARELALDIERERDRAHRLAWGLDVASTLATALALYLVARAVAQHHRLVEQRNRLLEERAAERLELFAGRVAHDVVGPLTVTRFAMEAASRDTSETGQRSLARGQRGIDRVVAIVDGLFRFARAGARPEPGVVAEVGAVVRGVVDELGPLARASGVELVLAPPPDCKVHAHTGVVASVVENLARNAIKYIEGGPARRVEVRVVPDPRFVRIEVADTGPGIPGELVEQLWELRVRGRDRTQPGLGLGLATVARIADTHGGRRGVKSRIGEGSTFWCELPRADAG